LELSDLELSETVRLGTFRYVESSRLWIETDKPWVGYSPIRSNG